MSRTAVDAATPMRVVQVDPRAPADPVRSRRAGIVLLTVVLLGLFVTKLFIGFGIPGDARAEPLPPAPPIGSCLLLAGESVEVTPCAEVHNAEVARSWNAGGAPDTVPDFRTLVASTRGGDSATTGDCSTSAADYLHYSAVDRSGEWTLAKPRVHSRLITAPGDQRGGTAGWTACIVESADPMPDGEPYVGSVRSDLPGDTEWPSLFGSCVRDRDSSEITDCAGPHHIEVLGWFSSSSVIGQDGLYTGPIEKAELIRTCTDLISSSTTAGDPTYGGRLTISAAPLFSEWAYDILTKADTGQVVATAMPRPLCFVEVSGTASLAGTVIGLGDNPLPLT